MAALAPSEREAILASLSPVEADDLLRDWRFWARADQLPPPGGDWVGWLILAGRGWGKTRTGAEWVASEVLAGRARRVALVAETSADGRDVMVEGESGLLSIGRALDRPMYEPSKRRLTWPNGAIATLYDAREPDQLRGPQHDLAWVDELAKYRYAERVWDQLQFGLRLGSHPRWCVTTTPRPIPLLRSLLANPRVRTIKGRTADNYGNLAVVFREQIEQRYQGTRLGRQELDAEILDDAPGALWSRRALDEGRVDVAPALSRVVVGIDPAVSSEERSNETGIIVAGVGGDGHGYVLDDLTGVYTPDQWARRAIAAWRGYSAERIVVEDNQGGEMVESVLRTIPVDGPRRPVIQRVRAASSKYSRAEPIAALYEQGRVHHVGRFEALEEQMTTFTADRLDARERGYSPDRVDALVWAISSLVGRVVARVERREPLPRFAIVE